MENAMAWHNKTWKHHMKLALLKGLVILAVAVNANDLSPISTRSAMKTWPVLKHYDQNHVSKIALPLGGIGTGTLSLVGRGDFRD